MQRGAPCGTSSWRVDHGASRSGRAGAVSHEDDRAGALALIGSIDEGQARSRCRGAGRNRRQPHHHGHGERGQLYVLRFAELCVRHATATSPGTITGPGAGSRRRCQPACVYARGYCCNSTTCQHESGGTAACRTGPSARTNVATAPALPAPEQLAPPARRRRVHDRRLRPPDSLGTPVPAGTSCRDHDACPTVRPVRRHAQARARDQSRALGCGTGVSFPIRISSPASARVTIRPGRAGSSRWRRRRRTPRTSWRGPGPRDSPSRTALRHPLVDTTYTGACGLRLDFRRAGYQIVPRFLDLDDGPAGSRWLAKSKGFKYVDRTGTPSGLTGITLTPGSRPARRRSSSRGRGPTSCAIWSRRERSGPPRRSAAATQGVQRTVLGHARAGLHVRARGQVQGQRLAERSVPRLAAGRDHPTAITFLIPRSGPCSSSRMRLEREAARDEPPRTPGQRISNAPQVARSPLRRPRGPR